MDAGSDLTTQRRYARLAGLMYLLVLAVDIAGMVVTSRIGGGLGFAERSHQIVASESLYRLGLVLGLSGTIATVLLAAGLYVAVRPIDRDLALIALLFRVCEAAVGGAGVALSFALLQLRTAAAAGGAFTTEQWAAISSTLNGSATTEIAAIFFSLGSTVFFYLFLRSGYIPVGLSAIGLAGSVLYAVMWVATLVVPETSSFGLYASIPILIAELGGGLWLLIRSIDVSEPRSALALAANPR